MKSGSESSQRLKHKRKRNHKHNKSKNRCCLYLLNDENHGPMISTYARWIALRGGWLKRVTWIEFLHYITYYIYVHLFLNILNY